MGREAKRLILCADVVLLVAARIDARSVSQWTRLHDQPLVGGPFGFGAVAGCLSPARQAWGSPSASVFPRKLCAAPCDLKEIADEHAASSS